LPPEDIATGSAVIICPGVSSQIFGVISDSIFSVTCG
jgi:hypothetical protein